MFKLYKKLAIQFIKYWTLISAPLALIHLLAVWYMVETMGEKWEWYLNDPWYDNILIGPPIMMAFIISGVYMYRKYYPVFKKYYQDT